MELPAPAHPVPPASPGGEETCPHCLCDLSGAEIPTRYRAEFYGGKSHYTRLLGVLGPAGQVVEWMCPDCGARWPRQGQQPFPDLQEAQRVDLIRAGARPGQRPSVLAEEGR